MQKHLIVVVTICTILGLGGGLVAAGKEMPLQGLQLWLKADEGVEVSGSLVTRWIDQSGQGNHAIAEVGFEPTYVPRIPGIIPNAKIQFDGNQEYLRVPHAEALNADSEFSVIVVYEFTGGWRLAQKKSKGGGLDKDAWFVAPASGLGVAGQWASGKDMYQRGSVLQLQSNIFDANLGQIWVYRYGELVATVQATVPQLPNEDDLYIAKRHMPDGSEGNLGGSIVELIIYNRALSSEEREYIEAYLTQKYASK